jgi:hypothetical protein
VVAHTGRRALAISVIAVAAYLVNALALLVDPLEIPRKLITTSRVTPSGTGSPQPRRWFWRRSRLPES